jgi:hypothetical protein
MVDRAELILGLVEAAQFNLALRIFTLLQILSSMTDITNYTFSLCKFTAFVGHNRHKGICFFDQE